MNKEEIQQRILQQRILQHGKPLSLDKFTWDEKTRTFSSNEDLLTIDFSSMDDCTIKCENNCTIDCRSDCTIDCGDDCMIDCGNSCTIDCTSACTINCTSACTIDCTSACTIDCGERCVCVRRDVFEFFEIPQGGIKLNSCYVKGYTKLKKKVTINIDGKEIELSEETCEELKKKLLNNKE